MTTATFLGYSLFRRVMAARSGTSLADLDKRAEELFLEIVERLGPRQSASTAPSHTRQE